MPLFREQVVLLKRKANMSFKHINICILLLLSIIALQVNAHEFSIDWGLFLSYYQVYNDNNLYTGRYNANIGITIYRPKPLYIKFNGAIFTYGSKEKEDDNIEYFYINSSFGVISYISENINIIPAISLSHYNYGINSLDYTILMLTPSINIITNDNNTNNIGVKISLGYHDTICYGAELSYTHLFTDDAGIKIALAHDNYDDSTITTSISASVSYYK